MNHHALTGAVFRARPVRLRDAHLGPDHLQHVRVFRSALAAEGVYVAARLGRLRVSPHVFNDETDADRFVAALARRLQG